MRLIPKPVSGEFPAYASMYIDLLPDDGRVLDHLQGSLAIIRRMLRGLSDAALTRQHAPGEWSIKDILVHIVDDERIYAYRALRFARGDATELPGFEQDPYAMAAHAYTRTLENILREYEAVRSSTLTLFDSFDDDALMRAGIANGHMMSVRAIAYHIAGHERHHLNSIKENYLD